MLYYKFKFDKRRFQQVLLNLLSNAGKFQKKGLVEVSHNLRRLNEYENDYSLEIRVADHGIGIDLSEVTNLF